MIGALAMYCIPISSNTISNIILIILKTLEPKSVIKKIFSIISSHNCLSRLHSQTLAIQKQDNMNMFVIAFCPVQVIYYLEKNCQCFPRWSNFIFHWYIVPVSQKGTIYLFWIDWIETDSLFANVLCNIINIIILLMLNLQLWMKI